MLINKLHVLRFRYVVTFSPLMDTKEDPQAIIIWDILTGQKKRGFHCESSAHWPIFKSVLPVLLFLITTSSVIKSLSPKPKITVNKQRWDGLFPQVES